MVNAFWKLDINDWELLGQEEWELWFEWEVKLYRRKWKFDSWDERHIIEFKTSYAIFDPKTWKEIGDRQQIGIRWMFEKHSILRWFRLLAEKLWYWSTYNEEKNDV